MWQVQEMSNGVIGYKKNEKLADEVAKMKLKLKKENTKSASGINRKKSNI